MCMFSISIYSYVNDYIYIFINMLMIYMEGEKELENETKYI